MLLICSESHLDHGMDVDTIRGILERFQDRTAFFIETFTIPDHLPALECRLYGPAAGDPPVPESEVHYTQRGKRTWDSRMVKRPAKMTRQITVIAGKYGDLPCVLYTVYGGPCAPQEPGDPDCKDVEASRAFWAQHALAE